jgi:predicted SAM-dependent methyltransferase
MTAPRRLNVGCGPRPPHGWINFDWKPAEGVQLVGDIREGLALDDASIDYAVAIHFLQDLFWPDIPKALAELKRVLKPGGVLRLALPDLDRAIDAYRRGDASYFYVPDEHARRIGSKLVTQIIWYGSVFTPFTWDFAQEVLENAGFSGIRRCGFGQTASPHPEITLLDNRERESLFVEAVRPQEE